MKEKKHWQLELSALSLKKNKKLKALIKLLRNEKPGKALEIGCDKGVISYYLRKIFPFSWMSCDPDIENINSTLELVKKNALQMHGERIPFENNAFDLVLCIDLIEHLEDDDALLKEINRVLRDEGKLFISVPHVHPLLFVNYLAKILGITKEHYNHKRDGYSSRMLIEKLEKNGFRAGRKNTVIGFFTELIEFILNFIYSKFFNKNPENSPSKGRINPGSEKEFKKQEKKLKILRMIYPLMYLFSLLDMLLFFLPGYILILQAEKEDKS